MFRDGLKKLIGRQYSHVGLFAAGNDEYGGGDAVDIRFAAGAAIYITPPSSLQFVIGVSYDGITFHILLDDDTNPLYVDVGTAAENVAFDLPEKCFAAGWFKLYETGGTPVNFRVSIKG